MYPESIPDIHRDFTESLSKKMKENPEVLGVAAGSYATNTMDDFSDLDFILFVSRSHMNTETKIAWAQSWGDLLSAFSGEHVGMPNLLICLYGNPLLHVDFNFLCIEDTYTCMHPPVILWQKDECFENRIQITKPEKVEFDIQWVEDRFWVWVHYAAAKIGRGEYFEVLDTLGFLPKEVLVPMYSYLKHVSFVGVRRIEESFPTWSRELSKTVCATEPLSLIESLQTAAQMYLGLRDSFLDVRRNKRAEQNSMQYLSELKARLI